jgi:hypothetical protein
LSSWDSGAVTPNRGHLTFLLYTPYRIIASFKLQYCKLWIMFMLQKYEANKNIQKAVNFTKSSIVDTDCLGNISYNRHNPEILVEIDLN